MSAAQDTLLQEYRRLVQTHHYSYIREFEPPCVEVHADGLRTIYGATTIVIRAQWHTRISPKWTQAAEILALLAKADWSAWKQEVKEIWKHSDCDEWVFKPDRIVVEVDFAGDGTLPWLGTSSQKHCQSSDLVKARDLALEMLSKHDKDVTEVSVRLRTYNIHDQFNQLMQLVLAQTRLASLRSDNRSRVEGESQANNGMRVQDLWQRNSPVLEASSLECLVVIATSDILIHDLGPWSTISVHSC